MQRAVVALALVGCGRFAFDPLSDGDGGIGGDATDGSLPVCTGPFGNVQLVPGLNTPQRDWAPEESTDGLTVYFGSDQTGDPELYRATRPTKSSPWGTPIVITELIANGDEEDNPTINAGETELYYGRSNTYRTTRSNKTGLWATPVQTLLTNGQGPFLSADDLTLYFTEFVTGQYDMAYVKRADRASMFVQANSVPLTSLNTSGEDGWPHLSDDELTIYFSSDAAGSIDLWTATRANKADAFGPAVLVQVVNSPNTEYDAEISADGTTLWFASDRAGGMGSFDIYIATRACP
jgi:Tol biopolymer transport system component